MGCYLEPLARKYLWQVGLDFGHGVGHGVSHCGPVHEHPHYAYTRNQSLQVPLTEGMIITNEPGFYKANEFGIRIENILTVKGSLNEKFLEFQNLTMVPYCAQLIQKSLLDRRHKEIISDYYQ